MLFDGQSSALSLVASQLAWVHTLPQLSWISESILVFGLALIRGCQGLVAQLQIVLPFRALFSSEHVRTSSVSI